MHPPRMAEVVAPVRHLGSTLTWTDTDRQRIFASALEVLKRVGIRMADRGQFDMIRKAGAHVCSETQAILFSESEIEHLRKKLVSDSPANNQPSIIERGRPERLSVGNGGSLYFDWNRCMPVPASRLDLRNLSRWAEGCARIGSFIQFCLVQEKGLDPVLQLVDSFAVMFQHTRKPAYFYQPTEPIHVRYLKLLQQLQAGRGYHQDIPCTEWLNPPLTFGSRALATLLARIDQGVDPVGMGSMVIAGMSAPATAAGYATMVTAELLGSLAIVRRLRPQVGLQASTIGGVLDIKTGRVSFQSPLATSMQYLAQDVFRRLLGIELSYYHGYRDANEPGMQACYEWSMLNLFHSCIDGTGASEIGGLANGNLFSPEQAVLDMEMTAEMNQLFTAFDVGDESIGLECIMDAGHDTAAYMGHAHTVRHCRGLLPFSDFWLRGLPAAAGHCSSQSQADRLLERAHQTCVEAQARGERVNTDDEYSREAWNITRRLAQELQCRAPDPLL